MGFKKKLKKKLKGIIKSYEDGSELGEYAKGRLANTKMILDIVKKLTIRDDVSSLNVDEKTFLFEILMEKKFQKDENGKYKILEDFSKDKMLDSITRKLLFV